MCILRIMCRFMGQNGIMYRQDLVTNHIKNPVICIFLDIRKYIIIHMWLCDSLKTISIYSGCVPASGGEIDHPLLARLLVRRLTPRSTKISKSVSYIHTCFFRCIIHLQVVPLFCSRKANIPGYTGHTHWSRMDPAHSDLKYPNPLTSARTHR